MAAAVGGWSWRWLALVIREAAVVLAVVMVVGVVASTLVAVVVASCASWFTHSSSLEGAFVCSTCGFLRRRQLARLGNRSWPDLREAVAGVTRKSPLS